MSRRNIASANINSKDAQKKTYKSKVTKNALLNEDLNQYDPDNLINEIDRNYREVTQQE